jgi:hypothetical protein
MKNFVAALNRQARSAVRWYVDSCSQIEPAAVLGMFATGMAADTSGVAVHRDSSTTDVPEAAASRGVRVAVMATAGLLVLGAGSLAVAAGTPSASASTSPVAITMHPRGSVQNMNAADGISSLEADGYNVEINWGGGRTDQSLSLCRIGSVDGLRGNGAVIAGASVYVTVVC